MEYAEKRGEQYYTEQLGIDFVYDYFGITQDDFARVLPQAETQELRVIRMVGDFQLPMPKSTVLRLSCYAEQVHSFSKPEAYFFPGYDGKPMTLGNVYKNFRRFLWKAGISHTGDGPRVHDFRHSYCVYKLKEWAIQDKDLLVLIPMMRTYLGHQTFNETAYYLKWTADVFPDIRVKLEKCYKDIIPEMNEIIRVS